MPTDPIRAALEAAARALCYDTPRICGCYGECKTPYVEELLQVWGREAAAAVRRAAGGG